MSTIVRTPAHDAADEVIGRIRNGLVSTESLRVEYRDWKALRNVAAARPNGASLVDACDTALANIVREGERRTAPGAALRNTVWK